MFEMTEAAAAAAERCEFQLTYARATGRRTFAPAFVAGEDLPCAYDPAERQCGDWDNGSEFPGGSTDQDDWIDHYASMAVNEAVHESLEWFRVDGKPWLDPHGDREERIYDLVNGFATRLADLRGGAS